MSAGDFASEYAAGWDAAVWNAAQFEGLTLDQLADVFASRSDAFTRLAEADELMHPESAAYKAGAAYAYRMAENAIREKSASL